MKTWGKLKKMGGKEEERGRKGGGKGEGERFLMFMFVLLVYMGDKGKMCEGISSYVHIMYI